MSRRDAFDELVEQSKFDEVDAAWREVVEACRAADCLGYDTAAEAARDVVGHDDAEQRWDLTPRIRAARHHYRSLYAWARSERPQGAVDAQDGEGVAS